MEHGYYFDEKDDNALAYHTTRWQQLLYSIRADAGPNLITQGQDLVAEALLEDHLDNEGAELEEEEELDEATKTINATAKRFGTEIFSRIYSGPEAIEEPVPWAGLAHEALSEIPEFEALQGAVDKDPDMAALATGVMLRELAPHLPALLKSLREEKEPEEEEENEPEEEKEEPKDQAEEEVVQLAEPEESDPTQEAKDKIRTALSRAMREAHEEVAESRAALSGLLPGLESAPPSREQAKPDRMLLADKLRKDERLLRVLRIAGKIKRIADKVRTVRNEDSYEEVIGIERGGDIARILPSELVGLAADRNDETGELLELLTLSKIVDRTAMQYKVEGFERLGRGPMVMLLDESGSMGGGGWGSHAREDLSPMDWAKAVALATLHTAVREHRALSLAGFDYSVRGTLKVDERGNCFKGWGAHTGCDEKLGNAQAAAWNILERHAAGGTSFTQAMRWGLDNGALDDRADILLVTDGCASISDEMLEVLKAAKEEKDVRVFGLLINGGTISHTMAAVCDEVVDLDRAENLSQAIGTMGAL